MAEFGSAIDYVLENEGIDSNDSADSGGRTRFGITAAVAKASGFDVTQLTIDQAKDIYRQQYWNFDGIADQRVATKCLDVVVNNGVGGGAKIIQRAIGVSPDGVFGAGSLAAINRMNYDFARQQISSELADHYVDLCTAKPSQIVFLKGWIRRAIRWPA